MASAGRVALWRRPTLARRCPGLAVSEARRLLPLKRERDPLSMRSKPVPNCASA